MSKDPSVRCVGLRVKDSGPGNRPMTLPLALFFCLSGVALDNPSGQTYAISYTHTPVTLLRPSTTPSRETLPVYGAICHKQC